MNRYRVPTSARDTALAIAERLHARRTWLRDRSLDATNPLQAEARQQMAAFNDAIIIVDEVLATLDREGK